MVAVAALLLAAACGGGSGDGGDGAPDGSPTSPLAEPGEGSLIIANLGTIIERDLESGRETVLLEAPAANSFLLDPAVSPDGSRIAYVQQPPPSVEDGQFDAGSDLWVMNRDGSGSRPVFVHVQPNQLVRFPRWEDDANILAVVQEISTQDGVSHVVYTLERIAADTGAREKLIENVLSFDVSPGGGRVVYANLLPQSGEVLAASSPAGDERVEVVGLEQQLAPFGYPRYSPDGSTVAFASADQTTAPAVPTPPTGLTLASFAAPALGAAAVVRAATLDGLPQDIWTVPADGGTAVRVADLKEDLPALTWDGSGERLYVLGISGLYEVDLTSGAVTILGEGVFHGQLAWAPSPDASS